MNKEDDYRNNTVLALSSLDKKGRDYDGTYGSSFPVFCKKNTSAPL